MATLHIFHSSFSHGIAIGTAYPPDCSQVIIGPMSQFPYALRNDLRLIYSAPQPSGVGELCVVRNAAGGHVQYVAYASAESNLILALKVLSGNSNCMEL